MAEILKEWLTDRLKREIKWQANEFGDMMKDGLILAEVLFSYYVISEEKLFLIMPTKKIEEMRKNWKYLVEWLHVTDVVLNEADVNSIIESKSSVILRLFYQLFLHLDKKDRLNFIKRERKMTSALVDKLDTRFTVNKVPPEKEPSVVDLSKPLYNEKAFIDWQRKKSEEIRDKHDFIRHRYSKILSKINEGNTPYKNVSQSIKNSLKKDKIEMDKFSKKHPSQYQNYTFDQLQELGEKALERRTSFGGTEWTKNYMDNLYTKLHRRSDSIEFQKQIRNVMSCSLWDMSIAEEETNLDTELAKKVMKLSQFEKQMCTQIMETKQQARNLVHNRTQGEKEYSEERRSQFVMFLDNVELQIQQEVTEMDFEKHRQELLHKKLYAEKIKRKRQHYYEICYDTMLSIVDYATKYAYFRKLIGDDVPDHFIHEWKTLYFKQQPIFDILEPMEDIINEPNTEEEVVEEEEVVRHELERQDALNDSEFLEYHNYNYPWVLEWLIPNFDPESAEIKYEYLGKQILGHLVYTLLEIKYPYPSSRPPAQLPEYTSKAVIRGIPDKALALAMQVLLSYRKIHVVRIENAINFCLRKFKKEMLGSTDIDLSFDKFILAAQDEDAKELVRSVKAEDESTYRNYDSSVSTMLGIIPPNGKITQTPKTLPEEQIVLSTAASLGRYAYLALGFGDSLTDHLLCAMIVEYLKEQEDINGFVIINYPNCYRQAKILEEVFSGQAPPDEIELSVISDDIYLEECILKHQKKESDPSVNMRISELVDDPHKKQIQKPFESYFTCYINMKETEDILQELVIWELTTENSELIDRFYATLGLNYSMYYEVIEKDLLAQICRYVIGELTTPSKSSDNLFGPNVLSLLDFPTAEDRRVAKSKILKPELSGLKTSKDKVNRSKMSKLTMRSDLEVIKAVDSAEEFLEDPVVQVEENATILKEPASVEEVHSIAGEEDWTYGLLPITSSIGIALATCWEEIERAYIDDLKQLFLSKRIQMNTLIPYTRFLKDKMEQIITMTSQKQDLVSKFQMDYNNFEDDWRDIDVTKNEWHCRIKELQNKLYHICDERKIFASQQRHALIAENWAMEELTTMVNTYISCMQAELNRSILTFQALHDFYYAMLKNLPANDRLSSKDLTKIFKEVDETSSKKGGEDKVYRQLKNAFQDLQMKDIEIDFNNNPFHYMIENNVKFALKVVKDTNDSYRSIISREYSEIAKIVPHVKKVEDKTVSEESVHADDIFRQNALKCIEEWTMGINGEMYRANLRFLALQYKCYQDMKLFNEQIYKTFINIQNDINAYYINEIKSVDRLSKYLQMAVENGKKIPETLILERDMFIIDPNYLHFPPDDDPKSGNLEELVGELEFKTGQLARLRSQFKVVSPTGIGLQQAFIYLLQDFLFFGKESCEGSLLPEAWKRVDPEQIPKLSYLIYADNVYVDWRDFLIYCLNLRFPTVDELLEIRHEYRCIDTDNTELIEREEFMATTLWFENEYDLDDKIAKLRIVLVKNFLFELFETSRDLMNYSALLLAFCKSANPVEGFVMALAMAVGKKICFMLAECEDAVCKLIRDKQYKDDCLACAHTCAEQFLEKLLTSVVNICEGTTIEEIEFVESPKETTKRGKSGKVSVKGKKTAPSQSARLLKAQKSQVTNLKVTQSASNVKTTFICPPCDKVEEEEKPKEKEFVQEEIISEPVPDANLAYAVSQAVILNVLEVCLPWHFKFRLENKPTPYLNQVKEVMKELENDTDNGDIFVCKFVSNPKVCKMLYKTKKFTALSMAEEIRKLLL